MNWSEMALVGRIARAHGLKGQVIVNLDTDFPEERFQPGAELFVERGGHVAPLTVTSVRFHRERPVIGLRGIESIADAEPLAGLELRVPLEALAALSQGAFYRHDLIGCRVETTAGGAVGIVSDVEGTMAGSRLVIDGDGGEILVPLAAEICREIDPVGKRIVIDPPDGLIGLNAKS
ncbi:MAG: 16S rRNA processing protein RimM [Acidobacteria bacterium]|nr:16S rRNA processing protein RimM [Acidobacteriota bacterium]